MDLFLVYYRQVHWTTRNGMETTFLYRLTINHDLLVGPMDVSPSNFMIASFAEDVLNNCLFLADRNGSIQYLSSLDGVGTSNCPDNPDNCEEIVNSKFAVIINYSTIMFYPSIA